MRICTNLFYMYYWIIIIFVVFFVTSIMRRRIMEHHIEKNKQKELEAQNQNENDELKNFEEDFFNATQKGEKSQVFITLASQGDCAVIRSLLMANNIPSYVEGEHMNNIYGGILGTMHTVVAIKIYILCKDYDQACEVVSDYVKEAGFEIQPKEEFDQEK